MIATSDHIREAVDAIVCSVHPISIVLFGSVAREGKGNDLDMMIVIDDSQTTVSESQLAVHRGLQKCYRRFAVDPFIVALGALHQASLGKSPFLRMVIREGRVVYMKNADREWMRQAQEELDTAEYLLQGKFHKGSMLPCTASSGKMD